MKNILLIGLGRFGRHIALQLNKLGHEVMAVDINEERVNESLTIAQCTDRRQHKHGVFKVARHRKL